MGALPESETFREIDIYQSHITQIGLHTHEILVEKVMLREKGLHPNTDYPIGLLFYLLDIPIEVYTPIFLCSRVAGLVFHVVEQHEDNRLFRPRVIYEGPRGLRLVN